jgi:mono/diheme cytochrome c family protein
VRIGRCINTGLIVFALTLAGGSTIYLTAAVQEGAKQTTLDAVYSADQAQRGSDSYKQSCASCHGDTLGGSEQAPALAGDDFISRWEEQLLSDLADRIRTSMPLDNPGSLSSSATADIVAYMLQVNNLPAGSAELTADAAKTLKIKRKG